ncbi:MAG TPA: YbhB/YbcL family Raf kinase inhibitor-like protein [Candidatus Acidoferrales bacterium]|nr:YbhB/YbcL family Raf kinase inhibitor-like protein [Candidatus Acidoferrales bacterium]
MRHALALLLAAAIICSCPLRSSALTLTSPDVHNGGFLATVFTLNALGCAGENRAPRLAWSGVPPKTKSFALTMIDPDAPKVGGFLHWIVFAIPPSARALVAAPQAPAVVRLNDFGEPGYGGPCPPPGGQPHHYHLTLDALDIDIAPATYEDYLQARRGHILASAQLVFRYGR